MDPALLARATSRRERRAPRSRALRGAFGGSIVVAGAGPSDLPDHAGLGDLHQRPVSRTGEPAVRVRLAEVPHRAVVDEVQRPVGAELELERPVDAVDDPGGGRGREGLVLRLGAGGAAVRRVPLVLRLAIEGEARERQRERFAAPAEVYQLDVVPLLRLAVPGREAEVALAGHQRRAL